MTSFNSLGDSEARRLLESCLAVPRWVDEMLAGRPYDDTAQALDRARTAASALTEAEVEAALARHPRIGERAGAGHDAEFSSQEQSGVDPADTSTAAQLAAGNAVYEQRFDRVFLIRAAGRSSDEILSELQRRLGNTDEAELSEVITQLSEIAAIRLEQVMQS